MQSDEFKNQPPKKQQQILAQLKGQFNKLSEAQPAQGAKPAEKK